MSEDSVNSFYDELAPYYHLLYGNWEASIAKQGNALATLLSDIGIPSDGRVLDAASGIGTQSIGLLQRGYRVMASDISAGAIHRLRSELSRRNLRSDTFVDDLRTLRRTPSESMSVVLACDNSIPHLLSDSEILEAFRSCWRVLQPGGAAIFSVRDYATIERKNPDVRPYGLQRVDGNRFLAVQVWEWDADHYDLRLYLTTERPSGICETKLIRSRYYAVTLEKLQELMVLAGFVQIERRDNVLFQPVVMGRRPLSS